MGAHSVMLLDLTAQTPVNVDDTPHFRDKGINTLFSDSSVFFVKYPALWSLILMGQPQMTTELQNICTLVEAR